MKKADKTHEREASTKAQDEGNRGAASKPISLTPLSFDEALDALLITPPEPKDEPKKGKKK